VAITVAFALRKVLKGSFCAIDHEPSLRISVFATEHIYLFLSVLRNRLSSMVSLT